MKFYFSNLSVKYFLFLQGKILVFIFLYFCRGGFININLKLFVVLYLKLFGKFYDFQNLRYFIDRCCLSKTFIVFSAGWQICYILQI